MWGVGGGGCVKAAIMWHREAAQGDSWWQNYSSVSGDSCCANTDPYPLKGQTVWELNSTLLL